MKPNSELTVPRNNDKARTILARRGDELRWFTPLGFKSLGTLYEKDHAGKTVKIMNDGWSQVDPAAFAQAPAPTTEGQVLSTTPAAPEKKAAAVEVPHVEPVKVEPVAVDPALPVEPVTPAAPVATPTTPEAESGQA